MKNIMKCVKYIIGFGALALALSSCVDVKIAATLPQNQYFSLQKLDTQSKSVACKAYRGKIGLLDIQANAPYDSSAMILFNAQSLQISELSGKKWINSPKEMLKTNLLQAFNQSCYQSTIAPFGTQKLDKIVKITLLSLQVVENTGGQNLEGQNTDSQPLTAQISIFYEVFSAQNYAQSKSGIITKELALSDSSGDSRGDTEGAKNLAQSFAHLSDELIKELLKRL